MAHARRQHSKSPFTSAAWIMRRVSFAFTRFRGRRNRNAEFLPLDETQAAARTGGQTARIQTISRRHNRAQGRQSTARGGNTPRRARSLRRYSHRGRRPRSRARLLAGGLAESWAFRDFAFPHSSGNRMAATPTRRSIRVSRWPNRPRTIIRLWPPPGRSVGKTLMRAGTSRTTGAICGS